MREAGQGPLNFWSRSAGQTRAAEGGEGRPLMLRQFPPARGAFSAGSLRQVSATRGMGGLGLPLAGVGVGVEVGQGAGWVLMNGPQKARSGREALAGVLPPLSRRD